MLCLASVLIFGLSSLWIGFHQEFSHLAEPEYCWCSNGLIFPFLPNIRKRWASTHRRGCKENIKKKTKKTQMDTIAYPFPVYFPKFCWHQSHSLSPLHCRGRGEEYVRVHRTHHFRTASIGSRAKCAFRCTVSTQKSIFYLGKSEQ